MSGATTKSIFCILLLGLFAGSSSLAGTYKWVDKDGNVVYSQRPPPEGNYESIRVKPTPRKSLENNNASKKNTFLEETEKNRNNDNKIKTELKKTAKIREKNCQNAKKQFEYYTVYRRLKGKDGEYRRIPDDEREMKLREARQAIKDFCD